MPPILQEELLLPDFFEVEPHKQYTEVETESGSQVSKWLDAGIERMRAIWAQRSLESGASTAVKPELCAERIMAVLLHRKFSHQSRGRLAPLLNELRRSLLNHIENGRGITFFLLYNGGYRASPVPGTLGLNFHPDHTELLLLHQISLLQERVAAIYGPGIDFVIVVNNGVSKWVNDISCLATEAYATRLRDMIRSIGAEPAVSVLVQSELTGYGDLPPAMHVPPRPAFSAKDHQIVERFLGYRCSEKEARHRYALYFAAEAAWAEKLRPIVKARGAIMLRQVAHPEMLAFRSFPGGATRVQNGSLGFRDDGGTLIPRLITTFNFDQCSIKPVPVALPALVNRERSASLGHG
jgi:hypothetical protein